MIQWVRGEIEANRIESVTICRDPQFGGIGLMVKWCGPGLISKRITGKTLEECFEILERIELPSETWAAILAAKRGQTDQELSFDTYMKSLGLES